MLQIHLTFCYIDIKCVTKLALYREVRISASQQRFYYPEHDILTCICTNKIDKAEGVHAWTKVASVLQGGSERSHNSMSSTRDDRPRFLQVSTEICELREAM